MSRFRFQLSALVVVCGALLGGAPASHALSLPPVPLPPANVVPPSISGSPVPGQTLTCSSGSWTPQPTSYTYTWTSGVTTVRTHTTPGATDTYTLQNSDVGQPIMCAVTASNAAGSLNIPAFSAPPVIPLPLPAVGAPFNTGLPVISGVADPGNAVTCLPGTWLNSPTAYTYSWQRNGAAIPGQTGSSYTLSSADAGTALTCTVVAKNGSGDGQAISLPVIVSSGTSGSGTGGGGTGGSGGGGSGGSSGSGGSGGGGAGGSGGSGGARAAKPKLKSLTISPRKVMVTVGKKKRSTKGTWIRYSLDRAAAVLLYIQQKRHGRWVTVGLIAVRHARAGSHRAHYNARRGKKLLALGNYRVVAAAANQGGWSNARTAAFRLVKKKPKPKHKHKHKAH